MQLHELMNLCTKLSDRVLALENANTSQAAEIAKLMKRIKKLEKKRRSRINKSKRLYKERNHEEMLFNVDDDLQGEEVVIEEVAVKEISTAYPVTTTGEVVTTASIEVTSASAPTTTIDELTMAQTLIKIKAAKRKAVTIDATTVTIRPKAKGVVIEEPSETTTTKTITTTTKTITTTQISSKDKCEGKMVEPEKPLKKKDQIALDQELAFRHLIKEQAELERVQIERDAQEEASRAAIIKELDNIQAMIEDVVEGSKKAKADTEQEISTKRAGGELEQEKAKKQRIDEHVEEEKEPKGLNKCLEIVLEDGDDVSIDATPLSTKSPKIVSSLWFARMREDVTRVYRPKDIINDLNIEFNIDVSYKRAWKGKQLTLKSNQGDPISSFAQLPYYCYNLKLANENTVTHVDTDHEGRFKMLFIAFGVAVRI
uniref:Transposase, MuDR, MULE transposase domain protein n=1 Tax=Tanacetum cinerariifolium TaxID=118510 RepID=A0A699GM94_TANCI|nr:transposase, MuDR, MULE transposase domain protein [Tanacetum cinerariifolium]